MSSFWQLQPSSCDCWSGNKTTFNFRIISWNPPLNNINNSRSVIINSHCVTLGWINQLTAECNNSKIRSELLPGTLLKHDGSNYSLLLCHHHLTNHWLMVTQRRASAWCHAITPTLVSSWQLSCTHTELHYSQTALWNLSMKPILDWKWKMFSLIIPVIIRNYNSTTLTEIEFEQSLISYWNI